MEKNPLLQVKDLTVSFHTYLGKVQAVRNLSFSINHKEIVGVVGESGCGKSVTAQSIMGLIPTPPGIIEGGEILFEGENLLTKSKKEMESLRGKEIGMVFQDPMTSLNPTMRVGKQIMEGLRKHHDLSRQQAREKVVELFHWVGISDPERRVDQYPHEYSGGMRQRAMIAAALACEPKLLIADEPTTALDVTIQAQIFDLMKTIQKETEKSIILITHDLGIVAGLCDQVIVMYAGQIIETGSVEQIFNSPQHPYTQGLLHSIFRLEIDREKDLMPIHGTPPNLLNPPKGCSFHPRCKQAMRICQVQQPKFNLVEPEHQIACWLQAKRSE